MAGESGPVAAAAGRSSPWTSAWAADRAGAAVAAAVSAAEEAGDPRATTGC